MPKLLISARTFDVIGSLDHNIDQTLLVHQKLKGLCQRQIYKSLKPIFKRYFNLFICTCNDYCSFNIKKSVLFLFKWKSSVACTTITVLKYLYAYIFFKTPIFHSYKALGQVWQILMKEITAYILFSETGISNSNTETVNGSSI